MSDGEVRKRGERVEEGDGGGARPYERDLMATQYRSLLAYHRSAANLQLLLMALLGVAMGLFLIFHDTPPALQLQKSLFAYFFMPFYVVAIVLSWATRSRHEVNDLVRACSLFMLGFGTAYLVLSLFNTVLLALDMSTHVS
jgi:uncharacterized membrane protein